MKEEKKTTYEYQELYHYTSLESLKSIIENKSIRLTDYRFLNDINEVKTNTDDLTSVIDDICKDLQSENTEATKNKIINLQALKTSASRIINGENTTFKTINRIEDGKFVGYYVDNNNVNIYFLSLTHENDDLALWNMYAKSGCRLKFNSEKLFEYFYSIRDKYFSSGVTNIIRGNIVYKNTDKATVFNFTNLLNSMPYIPDPNTNYDFLYLLLSLRKENAYNYENEYRIGLPIADELIKNEKDFLKKVFSVKNNFFKPQLELSNFPIEDILEDIVISPFNNSDCVELSIKEFLKAYLHKDIPVSKSSIKIR